MRRRSLTCAWALVLVLGCAQREPPPVNFGVPTDRFEARDYAEVLGRWTRHDQEVKDIGLVIEAWATLKSPEFREAYVAEYSAVYGLPGADREALRRAQLEAAATHYEFHLVVQTTDFRWNDLEVRDSPWKVTLLDATGAELEPSLLTYEDDLPELYEMRFYPYRTDFSRSYTVRFPKNGPEGERKPFIGPASGRLVLRIAGPLGRAEMVWQAIRPGGPPAVAGD